MFLLPLSHDFNIYFHTYSLDFCLYKLENSSRSFGVYHTSSLLILCTSPLRACCDLSLVIVLGARKCVGGGVVLRRISTAIFHGNCLVGGHYSVLRQQESIPSDGAGDDENGEATTLGMGYMLVLGDGEAFSTGKDDSSEFRGSMSPASSGFSHRYLFQLQDHVLSQ